MEIGHWTYLQNEVIVNIKIQWIEFMFFVYLLLPPSLRSLAIYLSLNKCCRLLDVRFWYLVLYRFVSFFCLTDLASLFFFFFGRFLLFQYYAQWSGQVLWMSMERQFPERIIFTKYFKSFWGNIWCVQRKIRFQFWNLFLYCVLCAFRPRETIDDADSRYCLNQSISMLNVFGIC